MKKKIISALIFFSATSVYATDTVDSAGLQKLAAGIFQPLPKTANIDTTDAKNAAKIALGQKLFFDPRLSVDGNISCNTCHNLATFGVDNSPKSLGHGANLGGRNSPTVLNAALNFAQFWDGRAKDVEEQAGGPILNPVEMALPDEATAVSKIASIPGYKAEFTEVYGEEEPVNFKNITGAIAAFERTLLTPTRFDQFIAGDLNALNEQEQRGLQTFINNGCISCHNGVNLGGGIFQKFGLVKSPYWDYTGSKEHDEGRFDVTQNEADRFVFRVPTLRNVEHTYPYFHDGSVKSLEKAVAVMGITQLGRELTSQEINDITTFLRSLSGEVSTKARTLPILPKDAEVKEEMPTLQASN